MGDNVAVVPYIVYESAQARSERYIRRLLWTILIVVLLLVVTNLAWMRMWNSYDYTDESVDLRSESGIANYIGESGDISGIDNSKTEDVD